MDNRDPISVLTVSLHCEVPGLGKPKAALFAFAMSLVASNALAVVPASLRAAHGRKPKRKCQDITWWTRLRPSIARWRSTLRQKSGKGGGSWEQGDGKPADRDRSAGERGRAAPKSARAEKPPDKKPVYNRKHKHFSTYRLME